MNYIIVDLEATCERNNRAFNNEIIEIGAVKLNRNLDIIDEFCSFVQPIVNPILTDFCVELTTITQKDVDSADGFITVLNRFLAWIGNEDFFLCSWGYYDKNQFIKDCELH